MKMMMIISDNNNERQCEIVQRYHTKNYPDYE